MRGAWAAFARDPYNGLGSYGWPQYSANDSTLVRLAYNNQTGPNLAVGDEYDGGCQAFSPVAGSTTASLDSATPAPSALPAVSSSVADTASSATAVPDVVGNVEVARYCVWT